MDKPYINKSILQELDLLEFQKIEQLHNLPPLEDQHPSELLASIRTLQPEGRCSSCRCAHHTFLLGIPDLICDQLVPLKDVAIELDKLGKVADLITTTLPPLVHNISNDN